MKTLIIPGKEWTKVEKYSKINLSQTLQQCSLWYNLDLKVSGEPTFSRTDRTTKLVLKSMVDTLVSHERYNPLNNIK